jgi:hypothetical protein
LSSAHHRYQHGITLTTTRPRRRHHTRRATPSSRYDHENLDTELLHVTRTRQVEPDHLRHDDILQAFSACGFSLTVRAGLSSKTVRTFPSFFGADSLHIAYQREPRGGMRLLF